MSGEGRYELLEKIIDFYVSRCQGIGKIAPPSVVQAPLRAEMHVVEVRVSGYGQIIREIGLN